ncbi:MAG: hypothetical protein JW876_11695 [Candidatus Krumholzibacteriota bacterium]|nr:hypothetical protein [Candidatus Krumholzibacteriota bacterium]
MRRIQKNKIGLSGKLFAQALFLRDSIGCSSAEGEFDLIVSLDKPIRDYRALVVSNLRPKQAGGKGKPALDWWIREKHDADFIVCVDLSTLRAWLFHRDEMDSFAQQRTSGKMHFYMYTDRDVALRGNKNMKFDFEFEPYRLENRLYRGVFDDHKPMHKPIRRRARRAIVEDPTRKIAPKQATKTAAKPRRRTTASRRKTKAKAK